MIEYRKANLADLNRIWDYNIAENPEDPRYLRWKQEFISKNVNDEAATFLVVADDEPVGEVTLEYRTKGNRAILADGQHSGYISALRIRPEYEGQGHVSQMMKCMENYAHERGFTRLTIGVEAAETRNLGIYLHWGYTSFILSEVEDGELILFYGKAL